MVIGFFMPLPLAMMIPFMGIQSAVMAKQFGENFQYGKRRISAMSNDEFNKLTPKMIQDNANAELKAMIPSMQSSITDMRQFQEFMIKEMIATIGDLLRNGLGFLLGVEGADVNTALQNIEHFIHGHGGAHAPTTTTPDITPSPTQPFGVPIESPKQPAGTPIPKPTNEAPPSPQQLNIAFLTRNAQGRILRGSGRDSRMWWMQSNINGRWTTVKRLGNVVIAVSQAKKTWRSGYRMYSFKRGSLEEQRYWILKSKIPT